MTVHPSAVDMTPAELYEDDEMARRISQRDIVRAGLEGKPATRIIARAVDMDGQWAAQFAVPGKIPDFTRDEAGNVRYFEHETAATFHAMAAAIGLFNQPRQHLEKFANSRMGNKATGDIRPEKMTPTEMAAAIGASGLSSSDLVFLLDKPAKRVLDWSNTGDIPHEVRLLLETWAKFDETVDFAFEVTNQAIAEAEKKKGR